MNSVALLARPIHEGWTLEVAGGETPPELASATVPAEVPGSVHTDLMRAGLIPDPYLDTNEAALAWMWRTDWRYSTSFAATPPTAGERIDLVFGGLDTVAAITLNGTSIGQTRNMHRSYRFDVRELLRGGNNELTVEFASALAHAETVESEIGPQLHTNHHPFNAIRKMACSFGWDWGPDLQTAGIWKGVRLERWRTARFSSVRPLITVDGGTGRVEIHVEIERAGDADLKVFASVEGCEAMASVPAGGTTATLVLEVPDIELWWPIGYGEARLYGLTVDLHSEDEHLDVYERRIGFRTITVDMDKDEHGAPFTFVINGTPVFIKGANWIPDDHLMTRITRARLQRRLTQAVDANMNLLRVWGGGIYETDDFYELTDEMGLLVWQDFLFACAAYDEGPTIRTEVEAEARENIVRLMPHPSLALYNGSNENIWGFFEFGWSMKIADENWGLAYYNELLPALVAELDPTRAYTPSSPFSPHHKHTAMSPNAPEWGTVHEWKVWNAVDYTHYRDAVPRFCSEFGFQGPATWSTITRALPAEALAQDHPAWLAHQKAADGNGKLNRGFAPHLPEPASFEAWHWTTQVNQARAVAYGIEHYRSHWPYCSGSIVWQLNDCWPVTSWAAVDGDGRKKPLWYALKHAYAPRLITFQPRGLDGANDPKGPLHIVAINDSAELWEDTLTVTRLGLDGTEHAVTTAHVSVPARGTWLLLVPPHVAEAGDASREVLIADVGYAGDPGHARAIHTFVEDKDVAYEKAPFTATATPEHDGYAITIAATGFVRDLSLLADKVAPAAEVSDALITLAPGESVTLHVATNAHVSPNAFLSPEVLTSVNALVG